MKDHTDAIRLVLNALTDEKTGVVKSLDEIGAVGHRIVHGGENFASSTIITDEVIHAIEECNDLAPLHNPANLIGIAACRELMPTTPMVAVFDTAFHQTMPEEAYLYGIPYEYYEKYKVRRYGFHGTSHSYVSHQAAKLLGRNYEDLKLIVCHLGNGASVSAVKNGKCVDTSMGLTPLEGLIMGTRSGDLDPAIIEFLCNKENKSVGEILSELNKKSGVLGLSGGFSSDFRDLEGEFHKNSDFAVRTLKAFAYRVAKYIGSYTAAMNGVDAICFTAGLGENSGFIREKICAYLGYLGITLDAEANQKRGVDIDITTADSKTRVLVIPTNEELAIARETYALVK
jgi:acetate kinase